MYMAEPNTWAIDLVNRMDDGTYWHVPATGCIFRIDKSKNRFVLIKGKMRPSELKEISTLLSEAGYHIITREQETPY